MDVGLWIGGAERIDSSGTYHGWFTTLTRVDSGCVVGSKYWLPMRDYTRINSSNEKVWIDQLKHSDSGHLFGTATDDNSALYIFKVAFDISTKEVKQETEFVAKQIDESNTYQNKFVLGIRGELDSGTSMDIMVKVGVSSAKEILYCKFNFDNNSSSCFRIT